MNIKKLTGLLCFSAFCLPMTTLAEQQNKDFQLNLNAEYLFQGNYDVTYDAFAGAELQYFFSENKDWKHFIRGGFKQNIIDANSANNGPSINIYSLDVGSRYNLTSIWNHNLYGEYSLGVAHSREEFSAELIDRTTKDSFSETNLKASLGLGMEFSQHLDGQLFVNQIGSKSSSVGFGVSYKF